MPDGVSAHAAWCSEQAAVAQMDQHDSSGPQSGATVSFQQALIALKEGRIADALETLTMAESENPSDARVRSFRGVALVRSHRYSEATAEYQEAIRLNPRDADAYKNLGFLEWTEHRLGEARESLEHALQLSPNDQFSHYYLGRVQLDARQYTQAFSELKLSGEAPSADAGLLLAMSSGHLALGEQEQARETLDRLFGLSLSPLERSHAAVLLVNVHEDAKALTILQAAGEAGVVQEPWVRLDAALIHLSMGDDRAAIEAVLPITNSRMVNASSAAKSDIGEHANAWSLIGIAYAHEKSVDRAVHALKQATALGPMQEEHWLNLTRELMEASRYAEAIAATQVALESNPKSYALHLRLGAANLSAGRYSDAEAAFRELVSADDPMPDSYVGLAQVLLRTGHADEAVIELAAAREKLGLNFLICYFQGLSLSRDNQRAQAAAAFKEALQLDPNSPEAHLGAAQAELSLDQVNEAIAHLEKAVSLSPGNKQARRLLRQAYYRSGKTAKAAEYTEAVDIAPAVRGSELISDFLLPPWQDPPNSGVEK